jgi:hypothetical protein
VSNDVLPSEIPFLSGNSKVASDYTFDASAKTVTISDGDYKRMLYVVNTTYGEVIYNPYNKDLSGTLSGTGVTLDFDTSVYMADTDNLLVLYEADKGGGYPYTHDYIAVTYPTSTTEVYTYKTGGSGGTTVATTTVTYTDSSKDLISTVDKS